MIYLYNKKGEVMGKFSKEKCVFIGSSRRVLREPLRMILRTTLGRYVVESYENWDKRENTYRPISKAEAIEYMKLWGYFEREIQERFADYNETETY